MALVLSGIVKPVYNVLLPLVKRAPASIITCLMLFVLLFVPAALFVGILSGEANQLVQRGKSPEIKSRINHLFETSDVLDRTNQFLARFNVEITAAEFNSAISDVIKWVGLFLYDQTRVIASNILKFFLHFFFMLIIVYFLLIDSERLIAFIINLSPLPDEQDKKLIAKFKDIAGAVLVVNGFSGFIQGLFGGVVFWLFGIHSALLWGVIMGILAFLPIIGIGTVFVPTAVIFAINGKYSAAIFFLVFYAVLSGIMENIVKPKLVGDRVKMHPLLVFLAIVGGLSLFGILGIIYGPLIVTAFLTLSDIYHANYQFMVDDFHKPQNQEST
jgi:predicted PurR-regulated permease PerM